MNLTTSFKDFINSLGINIEISRINNLFKTIVSENFILHIIENNLYLYLKNNEPKLRCYKNIKFKTYNGQLSNLHVNLIESNYISTKFQYDNVKINIYYIPNDCSPLYAQCGGLGWQGSKICCNNNITYCWKKNPYYSQCILNPTPPPSPTPPTPPVPTPPTPITCKAKSGTTKECCINNSICSASYEEFHLANYNYTKANTDKCVWNNSFNLKVCCNKNDASNGICYPYCHDRKKLNTNRCPVQPDASMIEAGFPYSFEMISNSLCKSHTTYNACEQLYMCPGNQPGDPDFVCNPCIWNSNQKKCYDTQCVGPRTLPGNYDTNCANGALATAKAWITGCDSYIPEGSGGRSHDKRVPNGVYPYSKTYCQKRCPVSIGLAHTESLYSPTAISPDWGKIGHTIDCPGPPMSDGKCFDYGGGYGLWQLDGRNDHVQKNFIEQIEGSGYFNGWSSGFFTPVRRNLFFNKGKAYKFLTPTKQAHWILDQTTGDFDSKVKLPGADWSRLMTCAGGPDSLEVWNSKDNWIPVTPYDITITTGIDVCTKAMKEIKNKIVNPDFFDYSHCSCKNPTNSTGCHVSTVNPTLYYN